MMTHSNKRLRWFREQSLLEQFVVCFNGSGSCLHSQTKTYDTTVSDATYGNTLQTTTRLTANDAIINITSSHNAAMTQYAANNLNQYSSVNATPFTYDLDGNLITNGTHACEYDAENRLILVTPLVVTNGSKRVRNQYDYKHRRIGKVVESYYDGIWQTSESHTFIYDGWNVIAEYISYANGTSKTIEYFWGDDLSNSAQGAGGIGGLLAISINGAYYFPTYDFNGNVTAYVSESGNLVAWYAYDGFGNTIDSYGDSSSFSFRFSTKYHDTEIGMYYYGRRFYLPHLGRWLNRDPIEEDGGDNIYLSCKNNLITYFDVVGEKYIVIKHIQGIEPVEGWIKNGVGGQTNVIFPKREYIDVGPDTNGKMRFKVVLTPSITVIDVYFHRNLSHNNLEDENAYYKAYAGEMQHVASYIKHAKDIDDFVGEVEKIYDCEKNARKKLKDFRDALDKKTEDMLKYNNEYLDGPGGPHGH